MALEIIACTATFVLTLLPAFDKTENRKWRGITFVVFGFCAAFPLFYLMFFM